MYGWREISQGVFITEASDLDGLSFSTLSQSGEHIVRSLCGAKDVDRLHGLLRPGGRREGVG